MTALWAKREPASILVEAGSPQLLCVWLLAQRHFHLYYVDDGFLVAFGAVERKPQEDSVFVGLGASLAIAEGAMNPIGFRAFHFPCVIHHTINMLLSDKYR